MKAAFVLMTATNMKTQHLRKRSRELWDTPYNQRQWVRAVLRLGDKWLFATPKRKPS